MEVIKAHRLLNEIESALVAKDSESAAVLRSTLALAKPVFINLLDYDVSSNHVLYDVQLRLRVCSDTPPGIVIQVPNNSSREQIQSGSVTTNVGVIPLDPIPDIQEILRLSDSLQINELAAFRMVLEAQEDGHELSAEAAAGYYFEERYAMANSLLLLLHAQIAYNGLISTEVYQTICAGNAQLLDETDKEGTVLVQRLLQLIRAASIRPETSSPLYYVKDIFGRTVQREDLMERECTVRFIWFSTCIYKCLHTSKCLVRGFLLLPPSLGHPQVRIYCCLPFLYRSFAIVCCMQYTLNKE